MREDKEENIFRGTLTVLVFDLLREKIVALIDVGCDILKALT